MSELSAVTATQLTVQKQHSIILDSLDFSLRPGVIVGLIGPSGSGKTTLMRSIVGVQQISSGQLLVYGQPAGSPALRSRIGYVTQHPAVYNDLTVLQNIQYFGAIVGVDAAKVNEIIQTVQLDEQSAQLVATLSGGQKARVSLAIALLGEPDLLVLDEPTVGLDPLLRQSLWQLFATLASQGRTLLISSHVMTEADNCDDLLLLRSGRLLWNQSRKALLGYTEQHTVEAAFISIVTEGEDR